MPDPGSPKPHPQPPPGEARPFVSRRAAQAFDPERVLRAMHRIQRQHGLPDLLAAREHLAAFAGRRVEDLQAAAGRDPQEDAQEQAFRAMESAGTSAAGLARAALAQDPGCVDALCVLAQQEPLPGREAGLRQAVALSQELLAGLASQDSLRDLWSWPEARPGLRARAALAACLEQQGRLAEAVLLWEQLLALDLPDTQGHRFRLIRAYFALDRRKPLQDLLHAYREDPGPVLAWARVLERLRSQSPGRAEQLLKKARKLNPHVEAYLTGQLRLPKGTVSKLAIAGSPEEAQQVLAYLGPAWAGDRAAMFWLFQAGRS